MRMLEFEQRKGMILLYAKMSMAEYITYRRQSMDGRRYNFAAEWGK